MRRQRRKSGIQEDQEHAAAEAGDYREDENGAEEKCAVGADRAVGNHRRLDHAIAHILPDRLPALRHPGRLAPGQRLVVPGPDDARVAVESLELRQIGRATGGERVCPYVEIWVGAVPFTNIEENSKILTYTAGNSSNM